MGAREASEQKEKAEIRSRNKLPTPTADRRAKSKAKESIVTEGKTNVSKVLKAKGETDNKTVSKMKFKSPSTKERMLKPGAKVNVSKVPDERMDIDDRLTSEDANKDPSLSPENKVK